LTFTNPFGKPSLGAGASTISLVFGGRFVLGTPKYAWLGAIQLPTELPSGVVAMGARTHVPQLGRFLQPDPIPGGSANAYSYTFGDPLTTFDPSGAMTEYTIGGPGAALIEYEAQKSAEAAAEQAAENVRARQEAEFLARLAAASQQFAYGPGEEGGEEEWEEGEEEEGEYVSYHHGVRPGHEELHLEPAVLYEPLGEASMVNGHEPPNFNRESERRAHQPSSRCVQYGGHWQGHTCVAVRHQRSSFLNGAKKCLWSGGGGVIAKLIGVSKKLSAGGAVFSCVWALLEP
jgi:RHS repeat-associated protein